MSYSIGEQLGNYRLQTLLGSGGFADVYLGEHIYLQTPAAIKVLHTRLSETTLDLFLAEARVVGRLEHPHIMRVLEFGIQQELPYLVMYYAPHGTIRKQYPRGTQVPLPIVIQYAKQVASALQFAHDRNVVHRDIKPENILLDSNGYALLSDFGLAIASQSIQGARKGAGTRLYMAPEQIQGRPERASDQYALGVVIYEWLCGTLPFSGTNSREIAFQHLHQTPPPLRQHVPNIAPTIEQAVLKALAKQPEQRFPSVRHFAEALEEAGTARSTLANDLGTIMLPFQKRPGIPTPSSAYALPHKNEHENETSIHSNIFEQLTSQSDNNGSSQVFSPDHPTLEKHELMAESFIHAIASEQELSDPDENTVEPVLVIPTQSTPLAPHPQSVPLKPRSHLSPARAASPSRRTLLAGFGAGLVVAGGAIVFLTGPRSPFRTTAAAGTPQTHLQQPTLTAGTLQATPTAQATPVATPTSTVGPTATPTPTQGITPTVPPLPPLSLSFDAASFPDQVIRSKTYSLGVTTNRVKQAITVSITYSNGETQTLGPQLTDTNGYATFSWYVPTSVPKKSTASLIARTTDTNGQIVSSVALQVNVVK